MKLACVKPPLLMHLEQTIRLVVSGKRQTNCYKGTNNEQVYQNGLY